MYWQDKLQVSLPAVPANYLIWPLSFKSGNGQDYTWPTWSNPHQQSGYYHMLGFVPYAFDDAADAYINTLYKSTWVNNDAMYENQATQECGGFQSLEIEFGGLALNIQKLYVRAPDYSIIGYDQQLASKNVHNYSLSYLDHDYVWKYYSQQDGNNLFITGLDDTNLQHILTLTNEINARGIRLNFIPQYHVPTASPNGFQVKFGCQYVLTVDADFKYANTLDTAKFALMDVPNTVLTYYNTIDIDDSHSQFLSSETTSNGLLNVEQGGWRSQTTQNGNQCETELLFSIQFDQPTLIEKFLAAKLKPTDTIRSNSSQNKNRALQHLNAVSSYDFHPCHTSQSGNYDCDSSLTWITNQATGEGWKGVCFPIQGSTYGQACSTINSQDYDTAIMKRYIMFDDFYKVKSIIHQAAGNFGILIQYHLSYTMDGTTWIEHSQIQTGLTMGLEEEYEHKLDGFVAKGVKMSWPLKDGDGVYFQSEPVCQFDVTLEHIIDIGYLNQFKIQYTDGFSGEVKQYNDGEILLTGLNSSHIYNDTAVVELEPFIATSIDVYVKPLKNDLFPSDPCVVRGRFDFQVEQNDHSFSLPMKLSYDSTNNVDCLSKAFKLGFKYAGIFSQKYCFASYLWPKALEGEGVCDSQCSVQGDECGGTTNLVSVFSVPGISEYKEIGCFLEPTTNIISKTEAEITQLGYNGLSIQSCQLEANKLNKQYVGVSNSSCWFSDIFPESSYDHQCSWKCQGSGLNYCTEPKTSSYTVFKKNAWYEGLGIKPYTQIATETRFTTKLFESTAVPAQSEQILKVSDGGQDLCLAYALEQGFQSDVVAFSDNYCLYIPNSPGAITFRYNYNSHYGRLDYDSFTLYQSPFGDLVQGSFQGGTYGNSYIFRNSLSIFNNGVDYIRGIIPFAFGSHFYIWYSSSSDTEGNFGISSRINYSISQVSVTLNDESPIVLPVLIGHNNTLTKSSTIVQTNTTLASYFSPSVTPTNFFGMFKFYITTNNTIVQSTSDLLYLDEHQNLIQDLTDYEAWSNLPKYWIQIKNLFTNSMYDTGILFELTSGYGNDSYFDEDYSFLQLQEAQIACGLIPISLLYPSNGTESATVSNLLTCSSASSGSLCKVDYNGQVTPKDFIDFVEDLQSTNTYQEVEFGPDIQFMESRSNWKSAIDASSIDSSQLCIRMDQSISEDEQGAILEIILGLSSGPGDGWIKVRHLPVNEKNEWHPSTDHFQGTESYGIANDDSNPWSIPFSNQNFDQFLIISGNSKRWIVVDKEQLDISRLVGAGDLLTYEIKQNSRTCEHRSGTARFSTDGIILGVGSHLDDWYNADTIYSDQSRTDISNHINPNNGSSLYIRKVTTAGVTFYNLDSSTNQFTLNTEVSIVNDQICVPTTFTSTTIYTFWGLVRTQRRSTVSLYFKLYVLDPSSFYAVKNVEKIGQMQVYAGGADGATPTVSIPFSLEYINILSNDFSGLIPKEVDVSQLYEDKDGVYEPFHSSYISIIGSSIELSTSNEVSQTLYLMYKVTNTTTMYYLPVEFTICAYTHFDVVAPYQIILEAGGDAAYKFTDLKVIEMFEQKKKENCLIQSISLVQDQNKGVLERVYSKLVSFDETKSDYLVFDLSEALDGEYSLFALGITVEDQEVLQPIQIEIFSYVQYPPSFTEELGEFMVEVKEDDQLIQNYEIFQYDSPLLEDPEGDVPIIEFEEDLGHEAISCESKDFQFSCYVDSALVTKENAGNVDVRIQVYDQNIPQMNYLIVIFAISIIFVATEMSSEELDQIEQELAAQEEAAAAQLADQQAEALLMADESLASLFPNINGESSERRAQRIRDFRAQQELVGDTFPGVDMAQIEALEAAKRLAEETGELPPEPSMDIEPMTPTGEQSIIFNQDMLVPQDTSALDYSALFEFVVISAIDFSQKKAVYIQPDEVSNRMRQLTERKSAQTQQSRRNLRWITVEPPKDVNYWDTQPFYPEGHVKELVQSEAEKSLGSTFYLVQHDPKIISFQFQFDNPDSVSSSSYGADQITLVIKNLGLFKSAESGSGIDVSTFESGSPEISSSLPAMISDVGQIESLNESTDFIGKLTNFVSGGNFVVSLILGGSLQYLWGFIRVMQMVILFSVVKINYPSHTMAFYQAAIVFASMDVLSGEALYEKIFQFKETDPLNDQFEQLDIGDKNFIMNSGSFLVLSVLIVIDFYFKRMINFICSKFARFRSIRKLGIFFHEFRQDESVMREAALKLFLESYFDLCMAVFLGIWAFFEEPLNNFGLFFDSFDNVLSSIITIGIFIGVLYFPYWSFRKILDITVLTSCNRGKLPDIKYVDLFLEGISPHGMNSNMYQFYFMVRRFFVPLLLIIFNETHALQIATMMIFSTLNMSYLIAQMPFKKELDNYIEMFNELTIMIVAHFVLSLINDNHQISVRMKLGWALVLSACSNMAINLLIVIYHSSMDVFSSSKRGYQRYRKKKDIETRLFDDRYTLKSLEEIEMLRNEYKAYTWCQDYMPQRRWCLRNGIDISKFDDEIQFQSYETLYMFQSKAKMILVQKAIISASIHLEKKAAKKKKQDDIRQKLQQAAEIQEKEEKKAKEQKSDLRKRKESKYYEEEDEDEAEQIKSQSNQVLDQDEYEKSLAAYEKKYEDIPVKTKIIHLYRFNQQKKLTQNSKQLKCEQILEKTDENLSGVSSDDDHLIDPSLFQKATNEIIKTDSLVIVQPRKPINLMNKFSNSFMDTNFKKLEGQQDSSEGKQEFLNMDFMHENVQEDLEAAKQEIVDHLELSQEDKEQKMIEVHQSSMTLYDQGFSNQLSAVVQFFLELKPLKKFFIKNELSKLGLDKEENPLAQWTIASGLECIFKKAFGFQITGCELFELSIKEFSDSFFKNLEIENNANVLCVFDGIFDQLAKDLVPKNTPKFDIQSFLNNEEDRVAQQKIFIKSYPSVIQRIFTGIYESSEICQNHDNAKPVYNMFSQNQIELDLYPTLGQSLRKHFGTIEATSTRFCRVCKKETEFICEISAHILPPILALQIDRYDEKVRDNSKLNYPYEISFMSEFSERQEPKYELMGVISNRYAKKHGDKYVTIVKRKSGETILFDPSKSKPEEVEKREILKETKNVEMLFYKRM